MAANTHKPRLSMPAAALCTALLVAACSSQSAPSTDSTTSTTQTTATTRPPGLAAGERLAGSDLVAAVAGNDPELDRINLVFAPWGFDEADEFIDLVAGVLSWDGEAYWIDADGDITEDPDEAISAGLGLFAIDPWRSHRNVFNIWYTETGPETPVSWLHPGDPPFSLDDVTVVTLAMDTDRFNPELTSVAGQDVAFTGPGAPERPLDREPFAHAVVVLQSSFPAGGLFEVAHELGHAMFNLPDEYGGQIYGYDGRTDLSGWPSCAASRDEADEWWGDLTGRVDPMLTVWVESMARAGFPVGTEEEWSELLAVGHVDGGCYGVAGSFRATVDSLMNSSIPVLGSVNRRWAEEILGLWDGS